MDIKQDVVIILRSYIEYLVSCIYILYQLSSFKPRGKKLESWWNSFGQISSYISSFTATFSSSSSYHSCLRQLLVIWWLNYLMLFSLLYIKVLTFVHTLTYLFTPHALLNLNFSIPKNISRCSLVHLFILICKMV